MNNKKVVNKFRYIKRLINASNDYKMLVEGQFYYNEKAYNYVSKIDKNYFMNPYYNLTDLDYLLMVDEAKNLKQVKENLLKEYQDDYADAVYSAFIDCLARN